MQSFQYQQQQHHHLETSSSDRVSHLTIETVVSTDYFSDHTGSTGLTSPSLASPKYPWGAKRHSHHSSTHSLSDIAEGLETRSLPIGLSSPPSAAHPATFGGYESTMYSSPKFEHFSNNNSRPASFHGELRNTNISPVYASEIPSEQLSYGNHNNDYSENDYRDDPSPNTEPAPEDVRRGPSVRSRASEIEASLNPNVPTADVTQDDSSNRGRSTHLSLPSTSPERLRSTSPRLRLPLSLSQATAELPQPAPQAAQSSAALQSTPRALPLPPASPIPSRGRSPLGFSSTTAASLEHSASPSPTRLPQGPGAARRMIAAWENTTPVKESHNRPLPSPTPIGGGVRGDSPIQDSMYPPVPAPAQWSPVSRPGGGLSVPAPLGGNDSQPSPPSLSASTWSGTPPSLKRKSRELSPAFNNASPKNEPRKSPFRRSPFKEIANVVKGFRHKNKDKNELALEPTASRSFMNLDDDSEWFATPKSVNEVPAGVFSDRMGAEEMDVDDPNSLRSTAIIYLTPGTTTDWDQWMTSWATLTSESLKITSAPVDGCTNGPASRIQMGLATPYSHIPRPYSTVAPVVQLTMANCVDVRTVRKDELRARRVPTAPEGVGTEVIELIFKDGSQTYIGVEGVAGRLSWVSAIWDAVVAAKRPPFPHSPSAGSMRNMLNPIPMPQGSHAPPVQKVGDQWVKSGEFIGESASLQGSVPGTPETNSGNGSGFRPQDRFPSLDKMDPGIPVPDYPPVTGLPSRQDPPRGLEPREADFDPVSTKPTCTLPLNVTKRSTPTSPTAEAPPLPPKKPVGRLVEERRRAWASNAASGPPTPPKNSTPSKAEPVTPQPRPTLQRLPRTEPQGLREALVTMFNEQTQPRYPASEEARRKMRSDDMDARIRAWQPNPEDGEGPNALSRNGSKHDTEISFDPNDLNPSRSASQIRRPTTAETSILGFVSEGTQGGYTGVTGLGLSMTAYRTLPALPPTTRKPAPKVEETPKQLELSKSNMPMPSRLLAARSAPATPEIPQPSRLLAERSKNTDDNAMDDVPKPSRLLAERTRAGVVGPRSPQIPKPSRLLAERSSLPMPKSPISNTSALTDEKSASSSNRPRGPKASLPKVSSAPRSPAKTPITLEPPAEAETSKPRAASPAPPTPAKSPRMVLRSLESTLQASPSAAPASTTTPQSPTPRLQSRVLAAAAMFEPAVAKRTIGAGASTTSTPSPSKRRKPVPAIDSESKISSTGSGLVEGSTKIGTTSALATGSRVSSHIPATPSKMFPKVPSSPPRSPATILSTPNRGLLSPAKFDITPKATATGNPYGAARAALRPTSTGNRTDLSVERPNSFSSKAQERVVSKPLGLYVVNKTPSDVSRSRMGSNNAENLDTGPIDKASVVGSGSAFSVASKIAKAQSGVASPWKARSDLNGSVLDSEAPKSDVKSAIKSFEDRASGVMASSPLVSSAVRAIQQPASEAWFRDQASCGEAESQIIGPEAEAVVMAKLDDHTSDHHYLSRQIDGVSADITNVAVGISTLTSMVTEQGRQKPLDPELAERLDNLGTNVSAMHEAVQAIPATMPSDALSAMLSAIGTDVRGVQAAVQESAMQIAALSAAKEEEGGDKELPAPPTEAAEVVEPKLPELHAKLDAIAHLIQEVLARQADLAATAAAATAAGVGVIAAKELKDEASGEAATKETPKEAAAKPKEEAPPAVELATAAQLGEIQGALKELEAARSVQTQQTTDIAKYLSDLNGWLEKFVTNSGTELETMSRKINNLVGEPGENEVPTGLVADIQNMLSEQAEQVSVGALQAQRLDSLLGFMGQDRERHEQQQGMIEQILAAAQQQREDTASLLQAIAVDLTSEIKGERVRFIESMRDATTMNVQIHVEEFKKALTQEVNRSMKELGTMREQKKALEHQIADLFALKAKHGDMMPPSPSPDAQPPKPVSTPAPRGLPTPPH